MTIKVHYPNSKIEEFYNAEKAFVYPGERTQIEISSGPEENIINPKRRLIFSEVDEERKRQDEKWGEQNHPMLNEAITSDLCHSRAEFYKRMMERPYYYSWFAILMEEVYESFAETDPVKQREELIQVAAVAVQIIEYLDRKAKEVSHEGD